MIATRPRSASRSDRDSRGSRDVRIRPERGAEGLSASIELLASVTIAEEAIVSDPVESRRQHVEEKAGDEFRRRERHGLRSIGVLRAIVFVTKAHVPVVLVEEPMIGNGDSMRVTADAPEAVTRPSQSSRTHAAKSHVHALGLSWDDLTGMNTDCTSSARRFYAQPFLRVDAEAARSWPTLIAGARVHRSGTAIADWRFAPPQQNR